MKRLRPRQPDSEVAALFESEPENLALATAIAATQEHQRWPLRSPSRTPRRPALVAVSAAVIAGGAVAVVALTSGSPGSPQRELLKSLGAGPVFHTILSRPAPDEQVANPVTGSSRPVRLTLETWSNERSGGTRSILRRDGGVVADALTSPSGKTLFRGLGPGALKRPVRSLAPFTRRLRAALRHPSGKAAEPGVVNGKKVLFLSLPKTGKGPSIRMAIASRSHRLLVVEAAGVRWTVDLARSESVRPQDFRQPVYPAEPVPVHKLGQQPFAPLASPAKGGPIAPKVADAYRLRSARVDAFEVGPDRAGQSQIVRGYELLYTSTSKRSEVVVMESQVPLRPFGFMFGRSQEFTPLPQRSVLITREHSARGTSWRAQLRVERAFVTVRGPTRAAVVTVARAMELAR